MTQRLHVHPVNPHERLVLKASDILKDGGLALCPTDAGYALVWALNGKAAEERCKGCGNWTASTLSPYSVGN